VDFRIGGIDNPSQINYKKIQLAADGIRLAARLTDTPTSEYE